jgi:hypothetical protein
MKNILKTLCLLLAFTACTKKVTILKSELADVGAIKTFMVGKYTITDAVNNNQISLELRTAVLNTPGASILLANRNDNTVVSKSNILNDIIMVTGVDASTLSTALQPSGNAAMVSKSNGLGDMEFTTTTQAGMAARWTPIIPKPSNPKEGTAIYFQ